MDLGEKCGWYLRALIIWKQKSGPGSFKEVTFCLFFIIFFSFLYCVMKHFCAYKWEKLLPHTETSLLRRLNHLVWSLHICNLPASSCNSRYINISTYAAVPQPWLPAVVILDHTTLLGTTRLTLPLIGQICMCNSPKMEQRRDVSLCS